jgi:hypothetical protein
MGGPHTPLPIALNGGLYLPIKMDRYGGHDTAFTIVLLDRL